MAKFKDDDFDLDKSLDLDFDDPFAPNQKDEKRGVIARVFGNAKAGARDAFTSPDTLRKITENILPSSYGRALSMVDSVKSEMSDLHSIVQNELKPAMPIAKRLTEQHLGKVKDHLPKNIADRLAEFAKPEPVFEVKTDQQRDEESLKASLSEVFSVQMRAQAQAEEKSSIEGSIRHAQVLSANRTQLQLLSGINKNLRQIVASNDEITQRYQRRNLEIQTRQLFMMRDSLKLQVETTRRFNGFLEAITKNTAMPDILKQDLSHTATQTIRTKFIGGMHDSAAKLAGNIFGRAGTKLKAKAKEMAGNAASAMGMVDPSQNDGMPGLSTFDMVTQMAVKFAITKGGEAAGRKAVKLISKKWPGFDEWFEKMGGSIENLPYFINEWARSGTTQDGWKGSVISGVKDFLAPSKLVTAVNRRDLADINKVASFNNLTQRSITEIIPGWLQRIHHSVERISDPSASPLAYDFIKGQFDTESRVMGGIVKAAMPDDKVVASRRQLNDLVDSMVGGADLDSAVRNELLRELMWDSAQGNGFDLERYSDPLKASKYLSAGSKVILGRLINASGRTQKWKTERIKDFHAMDIGAGMPTATSDFFQHIGQGELLHKAGILSGRNAAGEVDGLQHMDYGNFTDRILNASGGAGKFAKKRAKPAGLLGRVGNFINGEKDPSDDDLFVTPGGQPVLKGEHLLAGRYIDTSDGKPFYYWADCHGAIHDNVLNAIVADEDAMRRGFFSATGKRVSFQLKSDASKPAAYENLGNLGPSIGPSNRPAPVDDGVYDIISGGQVVMSAWMMRLGRYRDQLTGNAIYKPGDIAGPVVDEHGNVVVTARDIANILTDSKGGSYEHLVERMRSNAQTTANTLNVGPGQSASSRLGEIGNQDNATLDVSSGQLLEVNIEQLSALRTIAEMFAAYAEASSSRDAGEGGGKWGSMGFLDRIAWTGLKGVGAVAGGIGKGAWWWTKKVGGALGAVGSVGVGAARGTGSFIGQRVSNAMRGMKDIYVNGKREPALTKQKINFGHYKDEKTGKKITRWRDITGPVIDVSTGEYVIDQEDFEKGIFVKGPQGLQRLAGGLVGGASALLGSAARFYGNVAALPFKLANMGLKAVTGAGKWLFEKQVDVYVKGEKTPRLKATKMKTRRYYNVGGKRPGWIVETYDDIHGEIKELSQGSSKPSKEDITVLQEDEIHDPGLCNRWGMKLTTPFARILGAVGGAAVRTLQGVGALFGGALKGYGKLFGGIMGIGGNTIGAILGAPFKMLGAVLNPFEKHGERQVQLLEGILKLLEDRMPGKGPRKGSWQEQEILKDKLEEAEKLQEEEEERESRWGLGSMMSKIGGMFGRGRDDEEEEEEDDDGSLLDDAADAADIYDAVGDANERRRGRSGLKRGGGRWNRYRRNRAARSLRRQRAARGGRAGGRVGRMGRLFSWGRGGAGTAAASRTADISRGVGAARAAGGLRTAGMTGAGLAAGGGLAAAAASTGGGLVGGLGGYHAADWAAGKMGMEEGSTGRTAVGVTGGVAGGVAGAALTAKIAGGVIATLGAPVVGVGLVAAAAVGGLAYLGYKQYKYGRLTPVRRFRHMQYGVSDSGAGTNEKIFKLEELLINHVGEKNGRPDLVPQGANGKEISMEEVYKIAGVQEGWIFGRKDERVSFNRWFTARFKPVFLSWIGHLKAIAPNVNLMEAEEKLPADKMEELLRKAWTIDRSIYNAPEGPFGDPAVTNPAEIEDAFNLALKEIGKTPEEKNRSKAMSRFRAVAMLNPAGLVGVKLWDRHQRKKDEERATAATADNIEKETGQAMSVTTGTVVNTKGADNLLPSTLVRLGKLTATQAIRVRAYGLTNLDQDRVRALLATESHVMKNSGVSSTGRVHFLLGADQVFTNVAGLFGLTPNSVEDRARWCQWFINRFQPTLAAYMGAVRAANGTADFSTPERSLKPSELVQVSQAVMSAKGPSGDSVWSWKGSPWSARERLNSDSNAVAGSLLVLKQKVDKETTTEDKVTGQDAAVKNDRGMLGGMMDAMKRGASAASNWLLGSKEDRNFLGRSVDGFMSSARAARNAITGGYEAVREGDWAGAGQQAVSLATVGLNHFSATNGSMAPVLHPGGGSGGDINSLPTPPSNHEVAAIRNGDQRALIYKPLILAAAKMVGVDPGTLMRMCALESSFRAGVSASTSTATGLFQFVRGTWAGMLRNYGRKFGVSMEAPRTDPRANALMGACYIKENAEGMARWIGRPVTELDIYMSHFLGPAGYRNFCRASDSEIGARVMPSAAGSNRPSFYEGNRALTIGEIKQKMLARLARVAVDYPQAMAGIGAASSFAGVSTSVSSTANVAPVSSATAAAAAPLTAAGTTAVNTTPTPVTGNTGGVQSAVPQTAAVSAPAAAQRATGTGAAAAAATIPTGNSSVSSRDLPTVRLVREPSSDSGTFGRFTLPDGTVLHSLELPWKENAPRMSCIPVGSYRAEMRATNNFGNAYELKNVPGRSAILIHAGNFAGDVSKGMKANSQGCILLGLGRNEQSGQKSITSSRGAMETFLSKMGGRPFLLVVTGSNGIANDVSTTVRSATETAPPAATPAPSIQSVRSLEASAASQRQADAEQQAAAARAAEARAAAQRQVASQQINNQRNEEARMTGVSEILTKSYETQRKIETNTADAVTLLRQLLRQPGIAEKPAIASATAPAPAPASTPAAARTFGERREAPVSVRYER